MRFFKRRFISDRIWVKDDNISKIVFFQKTAAVKAEICRG